MFSSDRVALYLEIVFGDSQIARYCFDIFKTSAILFYVCEVVARYCFVSGGWHLAVVDEGNGDMRARAGDVRGACSPCAIVRMYNWRCWRGYCFVLSAYCSIGQAP